MIALQRILVGTDFSEPSQVALKYAKALATAFGSAIHVLHVLEDPLVNAPMSEGYLPPPQLYEELRRHADQRLNELLSPDDKQAHRATLAMRSGSPFVELVRYAKSESIDLIVLGTHGRGAIAHLLMGSVAECVVRKAPCPVLTVRHPQHEFVMP